jgi:hypothetical protein
MAGEKQFYQLYFQEPGIAEAELEADVRKTMAMLLYSASGDPPAEKRWRFLFGKSETFLDTSTLPETSPPMADRGRPGLLYRRVQADRLPRRAQLV